MRNNQCVRDGSVGNYPISVKLELPCSNFYQTFVAAMGMPERYHDGQVSFVVVSGGLTWWRSLHILERQ